MIMILTFIGWALAAFSVYEATIFWLHRTKYNLRSTIMSASWCWAFAVLPRGVLAVVGIGFGGNFILNDNFIGAVVGTALLWPAIILAVFSIGLVLFFVVLAFRKATHIFEKLPDE